MKGFRQFGGKMRSGHHFPSGSGFSGSTGRVQQVRSYTRKVPKYADGGAVDSPVIKRTVPMTEADKEYGGKGPLLPGYKKGGAICKAMGGRVPAPKAPPPKAPPRFSGVPNRMQPTPVQPGRVKIPTNPSGPSTMAKGGKIGPVKKGALHKAMGIKQGQKIPLSKLEGEKKSSSPLMRKRANFAINARSWGK